MRPTNQMNDNTGYLTMEITREMEEMFKGFPFFLEIEMLQGEREPLPDGRIKYKIEIADTDKAELMKEFLLKMISKSHLSSNN